MTTSKVCCSPRKVAAGKGRGGEETRTEVNNIHHREGGVKERGNRDGVMQPSHSLFK
jgi:hypothetical protein